MSFEAPKFDIFSGQIEKDAMWLESIEGLTNARDRMHQIAAEKPGRYFVFSSSSNAVLAETESTSQTAESAKAKSTAA